MRSIVKPIPKKSKPTEPRHFRPISLQSNLAKMFEAIVLPQMTEHIERSGFLVEEQFGFRAGMSTEQAVVD